MSESLPSEFTAVEWAVLKRSPFAPRYPETEKLPVIVVDTFPMLGKLTAMRFLEWVRDNPEGVVSLPTGKTPEHFIAWVKHLLATWDAPETRREIEEWGLDPARRPALKGLRFVQIDEFYPIDARQENSFHYYVSRFYLEGFGLDPNRALLIDAGRIGLSPGETAASVWEGDEVDLSLRYRQATNARERQRKEVLERVDQWCQEYEDRVRRMGGIGFFLGGIGPDGHVAFNVRGSDHHSTTRLTATNYETQAATAVDLGGIEVARKRLVITIGLGTLTYNPECVAVIMAAGEAKAGVVADAVERGPHARYPATALHRLRGARFYVTAGAATGLSERRCALLERTENVDAETADRIVIDLAVARHKRLAELGEADFRKNAPAGETCAATGCAEALRKRTNRSGVDLAGETRQRLLDRIEQRPIPLRDTRFLHTEPHHDDLMLGYLPLIVRLVRDPSNKHHFACLTGGFTSVASGFIVRQIESTERFLDAPAFEKLRSEGYFAPDNLVARNRDVWQYLDGVAARRPLWREEGAARRWVRNLIELYGDDRAEDLRRRMSELNAYFASRYPGQKDRADVQALKSMNREWEADCLWGYFGWKCEYVHHLRLGFYTGDIFTEQPSIERDVPPVFDLMQEVEPDVVTVALDPEASGPDTHYKVLQVVAEALRRYEAQSGGKDVRVWGYRNVWHRFHPAEANLFVPVSMNMFSIMESAFLNTFASQRDASFPSPEHDGPFCELAQKIQVEHYQTLKTCLGRAWFHEHENSFLRATRGFVLLKEMTPADLYRHARQLRQVTEAG